MDKVQSPLLPLLSSSLLAWDNPASLNHVIVNSPSVTITITITIPVGDGDGDGDASHVYR